LTERPVDFQQTYRAEAAAFEATGLSGALQRQSAERDHGRFSDQ